MFPAKPPDLPAQLSRNPNSGELRTSARSEEHTSELQSLTRHFALPICTRPSIVTPMSVNVPSQTARPARATVSQSKFRRATYFSRKANQSRKDFETMNRKIFVVATLMALAISSAIAGMNNPTVGGQEMYPTKNIIQNAVNSADHTTLVAAVKAAGDRKSTRLHS